MNCKLYISFIILLCCFCANAQSIDTIKFPDTLKVKPLGDYSFKIKSLIIPAALITYGAVGIGNDQLESFNDQIKDELRENIDKKITIDDFTQYLPAASLYGLSVFGIKSKSTFPEKTIVFATSYIVMGIAVNTLKGTLKVQRPDGSGFNSFPSGHTATAFMGAELIMQEYKHQSIWYGITAYAVASGTGIFRLYNNRHWLTDVVAGPGIGILSAKTAYWIYPAINKLINPKNRVVKKTSFVPYYDGKQSGFALVARF